MKTNKLDVVCEWVNPATQAESVPPAPKANPHAGKVAKWVVEAWSRPTPDNPPFYLCRCQYKETAVKKHKMYSKSGDGKYYKFRHRKMTDEDQLKAIYVLWAD